MNERNDEIENQSDPLQRREVLAGASLTAGSVLLAGCLGDDDDDEPVDDDTVDDDDDEPADDTTDDDDDDDDDDDEDTEAQVATHLENAEEYLHVTISEMDTETSDADIFEGERLDLSGSRTQLDSARNELQQARDIGTTEHQSQLDELTKFVDAMEGFLDFMEGLDDVAEQFDEVDQYMNTEQWDLAVQAIDDADDLISDIRVDLQASSDTFADIDYDEIGVFGPLDAHEMDELLAELGALLESLDYMISALSRLIAGLERFEFAIDAMDVEDWELAAEEYAAARDQFVLAMGHIEDARDVEGLPPEDVEELEEWICEMEAFVQAMQHFEQGSLDAAEDDWESAGAEFDQGEIAMEEADQC